jgi:FtsP/CotA-like multicopper oxidase with cupredoxin domain
MHNLVDLPSATDAPIVIPAGGERMVRMRASAPGTYFYWAATTADPMKKHAGKDSLMTGAIVVDEPGARPDDRILVLSAWDDVRKKNGGYEIGYSVDVINGRPWPFTERLDYRQGTQVTWRLINTSLESHPLHLHGFAFVVLDRGRGTDVVHPLDVKEVTEWMPAGSAARIRWSADRPGAWMFHCHIAYHIIPHDPQSLALAGKLEPQATTPFSEGQYFPTTDNGTAGMDMNHAMGGLVMAVSIHGAAATTLPPTSAPPVQLVTLSVEPPLGPTLASDQPVYPAFRYTVTTKAAPLAASASNAPPIMLTRGVPAGITVVNHLAEATSVHWHGIEVQDSYYDGGGLRDPWNRPMPMVMPGAIFEARFTPTRAGTFMYHTHMNDAWQVGGGLAGPLIVLDPGQIFDPATDHIVMITQPRDVRKWNTFDVNGSSNVVPINMTVGVAQRIRLLNLGIVIDDTFAELHAPAGAPAPAWMLLARDGYALDTPIDAPLVVPFTIGGTRDLEFRPTQPGDYTLEIRSLSEKLRA